MLLTCIQACKVPKRGFVDKGSRVDLEVEKYDLKANPWLKFFQPPAPKSAPRKDEDPLK